MCFTCLAGFVGVGCLTTLNGAVVPGGSAKERPSRAWGEGEGEGGEARSVMFYEGLRLWEARFVVFYAGLRLWGGSVSNQVVREGGSICCVLRGSEALGGSICRVLRGSEALGG